MQTQEAILYGRQTGAKATGLSLLVSILLGGGFGLSAMVGDFLFGMIGALALLVGCGWYGGGVAAKHVLQGKNSYLCGLVLAAVVVLVPSVLGVTLFTLDFDAIEMLPELLFDTIYYTIIFAQLPILVLAGAYGYWIKEICKPA